MLLLAQAGDYQGYLANYQLDLLDELELASPSRQEAILAELRLIAKHFLESVSTVTQAAGRVMGAAVLKQHARVSQTRSMDQL